MVFMDSMAFMGFYVVNIISEYICGMIKWFPDLTFEGRRVL